MREAAEEIIRILKSAGEGYISGQELGRRLGVSRTAVWKAINAIKKAGLNVESAPARGYRLKSIEVPYNDVGISSLLDTVIIGREIRFFERTDSTNRSAFELARGGAPEGTVVLADSQTSGKGRLGRRWESPEGLNLYASIILRPPVPPSSAHNLTFLSAVAVAETVSSVLKRPPQVKWPNDILVDGRKLSGILLEMDSEPDRVHFVIVGIGINVNMTGARMPAHIRAIATSLAEKAGHEVERASIAAALFSSFEKWYKIYLDAGFDPVITEWKRYFGWEGRTVKVSFLDRSVDGVCAGVDGDGALLVRTSGGAVERIVSGDVEAARDGEGW